MKIHILRIAAIFLISISGISNAQIPRFTHNVNELNLHNHIFYLASDSLQGRGFNSSGLELAADYLRTNLEQMGLASPDYGFFQPFTLISSQFNKKDSYIRIISGNSKTTRETCNFIALNQNVELADIEGELVFGGFGAQSAMDNRLKGENIEGKIILYSAGTASTVSEGDPYFWDNALEQKKMNYFFNAGAKALILVTSIRDSANATFSHLEKMASRNINILKSDINEENPPIFIITPETAGIITGKKSKWKRMLHSISISENINDVQFENSSIHIRSVLNRKEVIQRNVIGMIKGVDSLLQKECVVFMAHYDHLGTNNTNEVYYGADDNASGVATLLEVANMFSSYQTKPLRTILFLFPAAEEIGLLGSDYYIRNPVIPLENTVACINLDMVGRVYEERDSIRDHAPKQVKEFNGIYALTNQYHPNLKSFTEEACSTFGITPDFTLPLRFFYTSDHFHFHKNKIPVLNLSTGFSADYHKPTDTPDRIRTDKMKKVAGMCFFIGWKLANQE